MFADLMPGASIRFYAELNDFLPQKDRYVAIPIESETPIGDILALLSVPPGEVDLVLADGVSVGLDYVVRENDRISVYPVYESLDISGITRVRAHPLRKPRFVLDCHLGKLAYYMRMLGFDTIYRSDFHDDDLIVVSQTEQRTLLSRDRELVEEAGLARAYRVGATDPKLQVIEVLKRFDLFSDARPLSRCLRCNTLLTSIEKTAVLDRLPAMIRGRYDEFQTCPTCHRTYWKGSHFQRMVEFTTEMLDKG